MTQDEIIELAKQAWISDKEAQLITEFDEAYISCTYVQDLVAFAKLVAAKEREACAEMCKKHADVYGAFEPTPSFQAAWAACIDLRDQIRARGKA